MSDDAGERGAKAAWQNQQTETDTMAIETIRAKLKAMQAKYRRSLYLAAAATAAGLILTAIEWRTLPDPVTRAGIALMAAGWLVFLYQHYHRTTARFEVEYSTASAGFLRGLLSDALRTTQGGWVRLALPLVPGLAVLLTAQVLKHPAFSWTQYAPILLLLVLWLIAMPILQRRAGRRIRREIDELDALRAE